MGKIIECDFRRTQRREEIDEIMAKIYLICSKEKLKNPNVTEDEIFMRKDIIALQSQYADLILEEQEWSECKYYK